MLRSQYFVRGGKTRASRPHNFFQWLHRCIPSLPFCKYQAQVTSTEWPWPTWTSSWARRPWCTGWRWWWTDRGQQWRTAGSEWGTRTRWRCRSSHWLQHAPRYLTFVLVLFVTYVERQDAEHVMILNVARGSILVESAFCHSKLSRRETVKLLL